jgi:hypothetical protein
VIYPADEIHQAANKLRGGMWTIHPDIALPLAEIMDNFADSEYDREATIQETDARHERMLHLARAINRRHRKSSSQNTGMEINIRPAADDDSYARGFAAGRRAR